jgi:hypothetical protein
MYSFPLKISSCPGFLDLTWVRHSLTHWIPHVYHQQSFNCPFLFSTYAFLWIISPKQITTFYYYQIFTSTQTCPETPVSKGWLIEYLLNIDSSKELREHHSANSMCFILLFGLFKPETQRTFWTLLFPSAKPPKHVSNPWKIYFLHHSQVNLSFSLTSDTAVVYHFLTE